MAQLFSKNNKASHFTYVSLSCEGNLLFAVWKALHPLEIMWLCSVGDRLVFYTILPSICFCMFDWTSTVDQRQWNFLSALSTYTASTYSTNKGPCLCTTLGFWRPSPQNHLINHRFTQDITRPWLVRNICQERRDPPGRDGRERMMWRSAPHTKVCQRPTRTNGPLNTNRLHIYWDHLGIPKLLANISGDYLHLYIMYIIT